MPFSQSYKSARINNGTEQAPTTAKRAWGLGGLFNSHIKLTTAGGALLLVAAGYSLSKIVSRLQAERARQEVAKQQQAWREQSRICRHKKLVG